MQLGDLGCVTEHRRTSNLVHFVFTIWHLVAAILLIFQSCVCLTSLYGDKTYIGRFIFFLNRPFPFFTCIIARPPYRREAQGSGLARLPQRPALPSAHTLNPILATFVMWGGPKTCFLVLSFGSVAPQMSELRGGSKIEPSLWQHTMLIGLQQLRRSHSRTLWRTHCSTIKD